MDFSTNKMEFKTGHLVFCKNMMLRVIGAGESHITVIEYTDSVALGGNDLTIKTYTKQDDKWYRWGANGGEQIKLKKIGVIDPTKVPHVVKDFSQIKGFDTIIIKGVPYKQVEETTLKPPEEWVNTYYLKSKNEAVLNIQEKKRETLYDRGADAQLLTINGVVKLTESDVWTVVKH